MTTPAELLSGSLSGALITKITWGNVIFNVKDPKYGAKGDGVADDTAAIQKAINAANAWTDAGTKGLRNSPFNMLYRGGVVLLPPGIYNVTNLYMKSGVIIRGSGVYSTRINPIGTSDFTIGRDNVEEWLACIGYEDFTIAPTDEHFAFTTKYATPPAVGGIDFTLTSQAYVNRVNILNIDGIGLRLQECFDSYFSQMELIYVGADETKPAIGMYPGVYVGGRPASIIDVTNAIHMSQIRVEDCPRGLDIDGQQNVNKLLREVQFVGCKFEGAPIDVKHIFGVTFSACHFTPHGSFYQTDTPPSIPHVVIGGATADTRGIQFIGCTYISGTTNSRWMFDIQGAGTYDFKIVGGSVTAIRNFITATGQKIHIVALSAVSGGTPFIQSTEKLRISDCSFYNMVGGDYVIVAGSKSTIERCDFEEIDKGISMVDNCISEKNFFKTVNVHAHYVSDGGNTITKNRDDGDVVKMIEYSTPSLSLITFKTEQLVTAAPAGYNEQAIVGAIGLSNVYGAATSVTGNGYKYFTNPQLKGVIGGTVAGGETVTIKIQANYDDDTSAFVEKAFTATGNAWLTNDELAPLITSRLQMKSFSLYAKTSAASTAATASVKFLANLH